MSNNLAVKITADIVDLQTKYAVAKAETQALTSEMSKLARAQAAGNLSIVPGAYQQLASDMLHARSAASGYAAELAKATAATGEAASSMQAGHGSIATATREFRALFDELSSGRTRQTPGTLAIIATRVFGLGPAALGALGGVVALVGGLGYLVYRAVAASNALDQIKIGAEFAGNLAITRQQLQQFADEMSKASNISSSEAREIAGSLSSMHDVSAAQIHALAAVVSDFARVTGQEANKAGEELAKMFGSKDTAVEFTRSLGGMTQAQLNAAEAADKSGNAQQVFAAKFDALNAALNRSRPAIDEHNAGIFASARNYLSYWGQLRSGITLEEAQTNVLEAQNEKRQKQIVLLKELAQQNQSAQQNPEQALKAGVSTAEKENPVAIQIDAAKAKIAEMTAALTVAQERGDEIDISKLNAGLEKARENLANLQFGPAVERMREQMAQVGATWDGTQSGMLERQRQIAVQSLGDVQKNSKEYLSIEQEIARLTVQIRQTAGTETIANARTQIAAITGETTIGAVQRLERERDVWQQVLAGDRLTAAQRVEVQRSLNASLASINKERQTQALAISRSDTDTDLAISRLKIAAKKEELDAEMQGGQISADRKLAILRSLANEEYALNRQQLQNELDSLKDQPVEHERVYNQIRELKEKLTLDLAKLDKDAAREAARDAKEQVSAWQGAVGEIESAEGQMVTTLLGNRRNLSATLLHIGNELITRELANDVRAMTTRLLLGTKEEAAKKALAQSGFLYHLLFETEKTAKAGASEAARTTAASAGAAARTATVTSEAAAQRGISIATGIAQIGTDAAVAAAGAAASVAAIPFIGWIMAPVVAAETYATTLAYAGVASLDVGTNYVPRDMLAQIHEGEAVVPRQYNPAAGGSGIGSETHNHVHVGISGLDHRDIERWVKAPATRRMIERHLGSFQPAGR